MDLYQLRGREKTIVKPLRIPYSSIFITIADIIKLIIINLLLYFESRIIFLVRTSIVYYSRTVPLLLCNVMNGIIKALFTTFFVVCLFVVFDIALTLW